jgi:DNA cross-link repair 1A protein
VTHFLTHYHADHYTGLRRGFEGVIAASDITADLLIHDYRLRFAGEGDRKGSGSAAANGNGNGGGAKLLRLPLNERLVIDGVGVTALPANHCPGAVMLLFELPGGRAILHTGDFRWQDWMKDLPPLARANVDTIYLDTTYCLPRWSFPPQDVAITEMARVARAALIEEPETVFVCGAYHIGKEKAAFGLADALDCRVYAPARKRRTLVLLQLPERWLARLTDDAAAARVHVTPGGGLRPERLLERYGLPVPAVDANGSGGAAAGGGGGSFDAAATNDDDGGDGWGDARPGNGGNGNAGGDDDDDEEEDDNGASFAAAVRGSGNGGENGTGAGRWRAVVGFRPTGWAYRPRAAKTGGALASRWRLGAASVWSVPYSEHSSFTDLQACVRALRPRRIVPTVNAPTPAAAAAIVERFVGGMDLTNDRRRLDAYFPRRSCAASGSADGGVGGDGGADAAGEKSSAAGDAPAPQNNSGSSGGSGDGGSGPNHNISSGSGGGGGGDNPESDSAALLLSEVDAEQQARLLAECERRQRLRRSVEAREAAKKKQRRSSGSGKGGG